MKEFSVSLDQFEGPLDLMLHLISTKKLDLFDLKIDILIEQYILFLDAVDDKLNIAAEYLAELANLIEYKSKKLLPKEVDPFEGEVYQEDPKEALIQRILEYQRFKEISSVLNDRYEERSKQIEKPIESSVLQNQDFDQIGNIVATTDDLLKAMQKIIQRFHMVHPQEVKISQVEISIDARTDFLINHISNLKEPFYFDDLTQDCQHIHLLIVTFLSILEMSRNSLLKFSINNDEIEFRRGDQNGLNS